MFVQAALVYYLSTALAAPVPANDPTSKPATMRNLEQIVVSCLATIFACTWVSLHPNIPIPEPEDFDRSFKPKTMWRIKRFARRSLPTILVALLFPEYIVGWAIRQRLTAESHMKLMDDPQFTLGHAFFVIMGGVHKKTENGSYPLDRYQVASLMGVEIDTKTQKVTERSGKVRLTLPTEPELRDKSKRDSLAKAVTLIQTIWFIFQCIGRGADHLPVTELEVITLAYAILNFAIYVAWWDKPCRVEVPIYTDEEVPPEREKKSDSFFARIIFVIMGNQDDYSELNKLKETPNFYNGDPQTLYRMRTSSISFFLGTVFGVIHCIDWNVGFRSVSDQRVWRVSSMLLTILPFMGIVLIASAVYVNHERNSVWDRVLGGILLFLVMFAYPLLAAYLAARIGTIAVAIRALHSLNSRLPDALTDVKWTSVIPHV